MRFVLLFIILMFWQNISAQKPEIVENIKLEKALLDKDTVSLHQLLHPDLIYGHSNGWVETKWELIQNLVSGKMHYTSIVSDPSEFKKTGDLISIRTKSKIGYEVNGNKGELQLFIVQVWKKEGKDWKLLVRQSTRLN